MMRRALTVLYDEETSDTRVTLSPRFVAHSGLMRADVLSDAQHAVAALYRKAMLDTYREWRRLQREARGKATS